MAVFQFLNEWNAASEHTLVNVVSKEIDGTPFTSFNFSSQNKSFGEKKVVGFLWRPIFLQSAYIKSVSWMNAFNSGLLLDFDQTLIAPINLSNLTWCFLRIRPSAIRLYRKTPDDSGTTLRICFVHWSFTAHQVAEEKYVRQFFASLLYPIKIEP